MTVELPAAGSIVAVLAAHPLPFYTAVAGGGLLLLGAVLKLLRFQAALHPYKTWFILLPPIFLGLWLSPIGWAAFVALVALLAVREFARATGLSKEPYLMAVVVATIVVLNALALAGAWVAFLAAPIGAIIAACLAPILRNRPNDMLVRLPLAVFAIVTFGWFLAHLTLLATARAGLGLVIVVVLLTQFNDACAFLVGKRFGHHHWTRLSPNKTVAGSLGALAITVTLALVNWPIAYPSLPWWGAVGLGLVISLGGQAGDLLMATFKREVGIKDWGAWLPGHGGLLDRANSLLLVAPLVVQVGQLCFDLFPISAGGAG